MEQNMKDEPRPANDSRSQTPVQPRKPAPVERKPSFRQRWRDARPSKMTLFWFCLASVILTIVIGFNWGGWVSAADSQKTAQTMANEAVIQRLAPICVAQFNQDPDKDLKLGEMNGLTAYQRAQYVQDQGWATISGEEKPDRKVADACTRLLLEMSQ